MRGLRMAKAVAAISRLLLSPIIGFIGASIAGQPRDCVGVSNRKNGQRMGAIACKRNAHAHLLTGSYKADKGPCQTLCTFAAMQPL